MRSREGSRPWSWVLSGPVLKTFKHGTHRTIPPDETLARFRTLRARMGITRLGNVTGLDYIGIPVAISVRPNSRSVSVSQGKGLTLTHALASALMESIETFHAEDLDRRFRMRSARELRAEGHVADYRRMSGTGEPLPDSFAIPWIEGLELFEDRPMLGACRSRSPRHDATADAGQQLLPAWLQRTRIRQPPARSPEYQAVWRWSNAMPQQFGKRG